MIQVSSTKLASSPARESYESFELCQTTCLRIEASESITVEQESRSNMEQVISSKPVSGIMPETQLLESLLQVRARERHGPQKHALHQFLAKYSQDSCRLLRCDPFLPWTMALENRQLECVAKFHSMQPGDRQGWLSLSLRSLDQRRCRPGISRFQIIASEEVCVSVSSHHQRMSCSTFRTCSSGIGSGKIRLRRARCSAYTFLQGTFFSFPASSSTVYRRPSRRWMRTMPSRSQVSSTAPGLRSKSLTVNTFIADNMSDIAKKRKPRWFA
jgi:hypothetical protein